MSKFAPLQLEVEKPGRMEIMHPVTCRPLQDAHGKTAFIDLYSSDSSVARRHQQSVLRRRFAMKRNAKLTPEEIEAESVEFLCAVSADWYLLDLECNPLDVAFSQENARELYGEPGLAWLREQVDAYLGDRANFAKTSSSN